MDAGEAIQKKCLIHMTIHLHQKHHSSFSSGTYGISIKDNRMIDSRFWMSAEHFFLDVPQVCHTQMFEIKLIPPHQKKSFHLLYSTSQSMRYFTNSNTLETSKPFSTLPSSPSPRKVKLPPSPYPECLPIRLLAPCSHSGLQTRVTPIPHLVAIRISASLNNV